MPLLAILGWLLFGPRSLTSPHIAVLTLIFPICWLAFRLIRGSIVDFSPYPLLDVNDLGYAAVIATSALVALLRASPRPVIERYGRTVAWRRRMGVTKR